jgi:hypothetical protein
MRPYLEKPHHKEGLVGWLNVQEFKPQYCQKKKKKVCLTKLTILFN